MATKTGKNVQSDIIAMLKHSAIADAISGNIYRSGMRPRNSSAEDAVVTFVAGTPDQIQTGVVMVHIYVPDIDPFGDGCLVEDGQRTEALEDIANEWANNLCEYRSNYLFRLSETVKTIEFEELHQHAVLVTLKYRYYGGGDEVLGTEDSTAYVGVRYKHASYYDN